MQIPESVSASITAVFNNFRHWSKEIEHAQSIGSLSKLRLRTMSGIPVRFFCVCKLQFDLPLGQSDAGDCQTAVFVLCLRQEVRGHLHPVWNTGVPQARGMLAMLA